MLFFACQVVDDLLIYKATSVLLENEYILSTAHYRADRLMLVRHLEILFYIE